MLKVTNLETTYNDIILALKGISLVVPEGKIVALLGANGAGKTTTLNTISGIRKTLDLEIEDGTIEFAGEVINARTKIGRSFVAIRDRDTAAEAMGISLAKYKIRAFAVCAFYAGVAGSLMAYYQKWIVPGNFDISLSVAYIAMIVLGGVGTILGSILGAILITGIPHGIVYLTDSLRVTYPHLSNLVVDLKLGIFGLIIVLTLLFEPQGLVGIYRRIKIYWKTWPFKY